MIASRLILNPAQIQATLASADGPVARDLIRRATRVQAQAQTNASGRPGPNVQTGRLRSSIHWRLVMGATGLYAEVGSTVGYAAYVEHGTGPFVIRPANRQALYWPGAQHPVLVVYRSGNRPYPFLVPALAAARGDAVAA